MNRRTASILLIGLLFSSFALGQTPSVQRLISPKTEKSLRSSSEREDLGRLTQTIDRVERAFEAGDTDELEPCLSEKRIYLSLRARGEEAGYYGRSQVKFMLDKLFQERRKRTFSYDPEDVEILHEGSARFRAEWSYVEFEADDVVTEHLRFKLDRATGDDWRVSEIRAHNR
jgi:hypothetical protein